MGGDSGESLEFKNLLRVRLGFAAFTNLNLFYLFFLLYLILMSIFLLI